MSVAYGTTELPLAAEPELSLPKRDVWRAIRRGFTCHCPNCGKGRIFHGYTAVNPECPSCGEVLSHHRADDFPPYLTMFITGHIVVPAMVLVERAYHPEIWVHMALWLPLTILLSLGLLPPLKGAIIGLQWALYMHGFDPRHGADVAIPDPAGTLREG